MNITWKLEGKVAVIRGLGNLTRKAKARWRRIINSTARRIVADAKSRAPIAERAFKNYPIGNLRKSLRAKPLRSKGPAGAIITMIGTDVEYARYVEFGTRSAKGGTSRGQKAQPYLYPAARANSWRFRYAVQQELKKLRI
jgi:HK97 gp10 family phage protein